MPVVGSSAYNTAGQITSLVRALLNDAQGNLFTDAVLLPYANSAYRKAQRALANIQSGSFLSDDVLLVLPAVAVVDSLEVSGASVMCTSGFARLHYEALGKPFRLDVGRLVGGTSRGWSWTPARPILPVWSPTRW